MLSKVSECYLMVCYNCGMIDSQLESQINSKKQTRIVFMGTPEFALPSLSSLHRVGVQAGWQIVAVVTRPDRPAGRGKKLSVGPVKTFAQAHALPVMQPGSLRERADAIQSLRWLAPDVIVVAAYGHILPPSVLEIPTFSCLNVHASLLPAYRGAAPVTNALLDGIAETGVTIMLMDERMDTGPVLAQVKLPILADDTTISLGQRLANRGSALLVNTLSAWLAGAVEPTPQDQLPGHPSICRPLKKQDGRIAWTLPAVQIERMIRAYTPWPTAFTKWKGQNFQLWQGYVMAGQAEPGLVLQIDGQVAVGTGDGLLVLQEVQPAGKRRMKLTTFLNGMPDFIGSRLGENTSGK